MNRRTLLKSTIGIYAYTRIAPVAFAKENETHRDDVSMLYGSAWDILPQAADGKTEIVISSLITEKDDVWGDSYYICGVIHNNTDDECVLRKIDLQETSTDDYPAIWPLTIQSRSYALMRAEIIFDGEPSDDLTGMVPTFEQPDANYDFRMQINSVEWTDTGMKIEVENQFKDYDAPPGFADGLILWFDADAALVAEEKFSVDTEDTLAPGESAKVEVELDKSAVTDDTLFLIGVSTLY